MPASDHVLEPPTADQRLIWNIYFSAFTMPLVAQCDELGVFSLIAQTPLASARAAERLGITEEWAEVLLGALASVGLLRVQDGEFHLTDAARCFLLPEGPFYAGFSLRRFAARNISERLKVALQRAPAPAEPPPPARTDAESPASIYVVRDWQTDELTLDKVHDGLRTMHGLSFPAAVGMARNADFSDVHRLLDVAGGAGGFSIALAQRYPHLRCTVAELPIVCQLTQGYLARYGVEDRVDTQPLNMFFEAWPTGYDAVFFSCVLHDWDLQHRTELIQRAFDALPVGGRIFIHEMLLTDAADGPYAAAMYSLSMRIGTLGKQFTPRELRTALEQTGFSDVSVQNTFGDFSLTSARKR